MSLDDLRSLHVATWRLCVFFHPLRFEVRDPDHERGQGSESPYVFDAEEKPAVIREDVPQEARTTLEFLAEEELQDRVRRLAFRYGSISVAEWECHWDSFEKPTGELLTDDEPSSEPSIGQAIEILANYEPGSDGQVESALTRARNLLAKTCGTVGHLEVYAATSLQADVSEFMKLVRVYRSLWDLYAVVTGVFNHRSLSCRMTELDELEQIAFFASRYPDAIDSDLSRCFSRLLTEVESELLGRDPLDLGKARAREQESTSLPSSSAFLADCLTSIRRAISWVGETPLKFPPKDLRDPLSDTEQTILAAIPMLEDPEGDELPTQKMIARATGLSERCVANHLREGGRLRSQFCVSHRKGVGYFRRH